MGSSSCLPAREASLRSSSLLRFLSSRTDECTGNEGPGLDENHNAITGRLGLGLVGLEVDALSSGALFARDRDNQLFLGLGRRWVPAETACGTFDRLDWGDGDGCDFFADGSRSRRQQQKKTLPNINELLGGRSHALVHGFRANILSGIARGATSSLRASATRALTAMLS